MSAVASTLVESGESHASRGSRCRERRRRERDEGTQTRAGQLVAALPGLDEKGRAELEKNVARAGMAVSKSLEGYGTPLLVGPVLYSSVFLVPVVWLVSTHAAQLRTGAAVLHLVLGFAGALLCVCAGVLLVAWDMRLTWRTAEPP